MIAVNSRRWTRERLQRAVAATRDGAQPLELLVEHGEHFTSHVVDYRDGARYARLERDSSRPDLLTSILTPLTTVAAR